MFAEGEGLVECDAQELGIRVEWDDGSADLDPWSDQWQTSHLDAFSVSFHFLLQSLTRLTAH